MTARFALSLLVAVASASTPGHAQQSDSTLADSAVARLMAVMAGASAASLDEPLALLDRALAATPGNEVVLHYKGYALYRKANALLGDGARKNEFKALLQEADRTLEQSAGALRWPETLALRASVVGQLIGVSGVFAAPRLGPRSNSLMDQAVALGPTNPRVWLLRGILAFHKPKMFGGGLDNAERDLKKAIELFPGQQAVAPMPAWGHAEAWAWLGRVYAAQKRSADARAAYGRALELEPRLDWVSQQLLPALDSGSR